MCAKQVDLNDFKYIDAEEFYEDANQEDLSISSEVVAFSEEEKEVIHLISEQLKDTEPDTLDFIGKCTLDIVQDTGNGCFCISQLCTEC